MTDTPNPRDTERLAEAGELVRAVEWHLTRGDSEDNDYEGATKMVAAVLASRDAALAEARDQAAAEAEAFRDEQAANTELRAALADKERELREAQEELADVRVGTQRAAEKWLAERKDLRAEVESLRAALVRVAAHDWSWKGDGSDSRFSGFSGRIARQALGAPLDPEPYDGTNGTPRNQDQPRPTPAASGEPKPDLTRWRGAFKGMPDDNGWPEDEPSPPAPADLAERAADHEPAPWCRDALFVLTTVGDGEATTLHHGWAAICDAVVGVHYHEPDIDQRDEVMAWLLDWEEWSNAPDGHPWRWEKYHDDVAVYVWRVTDAAALAAVRDEATRRACEQAALLFEEQVEPESGPEFEAASEQERSAIRENNSFYRGYAARIRALADQPPPDTTEG